MIRRANGLERYGYINTRPAASVFETLREEFSLDRLIQMNGHRKALCVSHSEVTPSMHVYEDYAHCFGCSFHGDVVDVWAAQRGIDRPIEAALDLAWEFNIQLPEMSEEGRQKAEQRRIKEAGYLEMAREFHETLLPSRHMPSSNSATVREWWKGRGFGEEDMRRFLLGAAPVGEVATIPFWHRGRVQGLIRRKLEGEPKYRFPNAEEFPEGCKPLFIPTPIKREIFLVEGHIDALAVAVTGRSAIAIGGTNISEAQSAELHKVVPEDATVYILPDRDGQGAEAAKVWARTLYPAARICPADYGDAKHKDVADLFSAVGGFPEKTAEHLARLVEASVDILDVEMGIAREITDRPDRLAYASKNIAPLLTPIHPKGLRDATADIVAETTSLKKSWINSAIKDAVTQQEVEFSKQIIKRLEEEVAAEEEAYRQTVAEAQPEINECLAPGVLHRLRDTAATMHSVYGDAVPLELALLVALGAQLAPLPNGRPLGASILLTATAGRGKNHIVDAAVKPLPPEFYFAFEIASGQSLYYKAEEDPDFLKHTFAYPNEIEGAEALWGFLRPMLSKGKVTKIVTAKDEDGNSVSKTIIVEGPVTIAIPTIRNKTDDQLQTRLLVAELPDYVGRVRDHSFAISRQLLPGVRSKDYSRERWIWREALRRLTDVRRVVFPLEHKKFALDDDQISHGARLWANLLSLMATHAWLEQKNRRLVEVDEDTVAVEATPEDYAAAHAIFTEVCERSVINLSEVHRKILDATCDLHEEHGERGGFSQREIARKAGVSPQTISNNKTFLVTSAKFLRETDAGLALVAGIEPEEWRAADITKGLPTPDQVRAWWEEKEPDPPDGQKNAGHAGRGSETSQKADTYGEKPVYRGGEHSMDVSTSPTGADNTNGHVHQISTEGMDSENGIGKPDTGDKENLSTVSTDFCVHGTGDPQTCDECDLDKRFGDPGVRI